VRAARSQAEYALGVAVPDAIGGGGGEARHQIQGVLHAAALMRVVTAIEDIVGVVSLEEAIHDHAGEGKGGVEGEPHAPHEVVGGPPQ